MSSQKGGFSLSNVDLLACGLGACIILMLAFIVNVDGKEGNKGPKSQEAMGVVQSVFIPEEVQEGKMVFVRQVEIHCDAKADYHFFKKHPDACQWHYDETLKRTGRVEEQVYFVPGSQAIVYSIKSDTLIKSPIRLHLNDVLLRNHVEFGVRGAQISAKLLEGATSNKVGEEVFSGFYEKPTETIQYLRQLDVSFTRGAVGTKDQLNQLIQISG